MINEKGFTLVDSLVAVAVAAFVGLGAVALTFQTLKVTAQDNAWATVVRQAQDVGYWTSQDAQSATAVQAVTGAPGDGVAFMTFFWDDWETGDLYQVSYVWRSAGGLYKIERVYLKNGVAQTAMIADHVVGGGTALEQQGTAWKLTVVVQAGLSDAPKTATTSYLIEPRPTVQP